MKRRIYKRYRTRKKGGQRYWVGRKPRKNYGSPKYRFVKRADAWLNTKTGAYVRPEDNDEEFDAWERNNFEKFLKKHGTEEDIKKHRENIQKIEEEADEELRTRYGVKKNYGMAFDISKETGYPIFDFPESFGKIGKKKMYKPEEIVDLMKNPKTTREEFARLMKGSPGDESKMLKAGVFNIEGLKKAIQSKKKEVPPVMIELDDQGRVRFSEGRHRAVAAMELGVEIPAIIIKPKPRESFEEEQERIVKEQR